MRAVSNNNPEAKLVSAQVAEYLRTGGRVSVIPFGIGSETPVLNEQENRAAIKKSTGDCFVPGVFNPHSEASRKAYSRGGKS